MSRFFINNWSFFPENAELKSKISKEIGVSSLIAQLLMNRGMKDTDEINKFLFPKLSFLRDPFLLKDMDLAADRIVAAVKNKEKICIFGDFDVDGITATAIMMRFAKFAGAEANYYIPDRINEGYGLNVKAIKKIADEGFKLLITVDNGTSSYDEVEYANSLKMDVIITDHHQPPEKLPPAVAIVNPHRPDCQYPYQSLAGAGIAYKLVHATLKKLGIESESAKAFLTELIEFVAIGTIADIVSILDENRALVKYGLQLIQKTKNVGLNTMLQLLGLNNKPLSCTSVGFYIAPRLNAAGRTNHASTSVELLLADEPLKAGEICRYLDKLNSERMSLEEEILKDCIDTIKSEIDLDKEKIIVVKGEGWHIGVLGIVASRLVETFNKPAIILSLDKSIARGSGRSNEAYNIHEGIKACSQYLLSFGGHKRAAGLKLEIKNLDAFTKAICDHAIANINEKSVKSNFQIDAEIAPQDITMEFLSALNELKPHGPGNPVPVFLMRNIRFADAPRVVGKNHLKCSITKDSKVFNAIAYSAADYLPTFKNVSYFWDVALTPFLNEWNGCQSIEFEIKAIAPSVA